MITIKTLEPQDYDRLLAFAKRTFIDTYAEYNTPENMQLHIEKTYTVAALLQELDLPDTEYSLAYDVENLIGYCKVRCTLHPPELENEKHIELERLYVDKAYKGQGVGKKMINHCAENARNNGFEVLWLGVWSRNENALAFYKKLNFQQFGTHTFVLGEDQQIDFLMKINLNAAV